jgi:hypothetical protein
MVAQAGNPYKGKEAGIYARAALEKSLMGALYLDLRFLFDNTTDPGDGAAAQPRNLLTGLGYHF